MEWIQMLQSIDLEHLFWFLLVLAIFFGGAFQQLVGAISKRLSGGGGKANKALQAEVARLSETVAAMESRLEAAESRAEAAQDLALAAEEKTRFLEGLLEAPEESRARLRNPASRESTSVRL